MITKNKKRTDKPKDPSEMTDRRQLSRSRPVTRMSGSQDNLSPRPRERSIPRGQKAAQLCNGFKKGYCPYGTSCRYSHDMGALSDRDLLEKIANTQVYMINRISNIEKQVNSLSERVIDPRKAQGDSDFFHQMQTALNDGTITRDKAEEVIQSRLPYIKRDSVTTWGANTKADPEIVQVINLMAEGMAAGQQGITGLLQSIGSRQITSMLEVILTDLSMTVDAEADIQDMMTKVAALKLAPK